MVRDGRAVTYSFLTKSNQTKDVETVINGLSAWNYNNRDYKKQCDKIGPQYCKLVKYEDLILKSNETIKDVVKFLNISWTDGFLHHEDYVGSKIKVKETEWSTGQIKKKINKEALTSWIGNLYYQDKDIKMLTMFREFGYITNITFNQ